MKHPCITLSSIFFYYRKICKYLHWNSYDHSHCRKLIIIDMNGLIVERKSFTNPIRASKMCFIWKRPHSDVFIKFILKNFDVAVWSSAQPHNVERMVNFIFEDSKKELIFVWDQSKCILERRENYKYPLFLKPIDKVLKFFPEYRDNILFIDDSPDKLKYNEKFTSICPSTWDHRQKDDCIMDINGKLNVYLKNMLDEKYSSVQEYVKNNEY